MKSLKKKKVKLNLIIRFVRPSLSFTAELSEPGVWFTPTADVRTDHRRGPRLSLGAHSGPAGQSRLRAEGA